MVEKWSWDGGVGCVVMEEWVACTEERGGKRMYQDGWMEVLGRERGQQMTSG